MVPMTSIRVKDPITTIEMGVGGISIDFRVKPFEMKGAFDGFCLELTHLEMEQLHHNLGQRLQTLKTAPEFVPTRIPRGPRTSKFLGVSRGDQATKFRVQLKHDGKYLCKFFDSEIDAAKQYNEWVKETGADRPLNVIP